MNEPGQAKGRVALNGGDWVLASPGTDGTLRPTSSRLSPSLQSDAC
jgi:hypothetical protein